MTFMSNESTTRSGDGGLHRLLVSIVVTGCVALGLALAFIPQAQDLSDIGGYTTAAQGGPTRDLRPALQSALARQHELTLSETEINQWLGRTLVAKQSGGFANAVTLERVWVRLLDGYAEVVIARKILGLPFTVSMFLQVAKTQESNGTLTEVLLHGGPYAPSLPSVPLRGGRFGKLVVPQGFLLLVMPAYARLADVFRDEIHLGFEEMAHVKIAKGSLVMDPRERETDTSGRPKSF